ncbi:hypothetical protein CBR_g53725 [Chara braunii]|uniref:DDE Tnp4 domain-containing protein n=1 Tax=Chara braunii TaxID=69332 RepID=A0A388MB87_CHABU|nr:hypothetical protein CBR_g53725 [Chara braunii]|eukprot:GBG91834.1 hypothetical protein CBR_g53725 [Chara braunii]
MARRGGYGEEGEDVEEEEEDVDDEDKEDSEDDEESSSRWGEEKRWTEGPGGKEEGQEEEDEWEEEETWTARKWRARGRRGHEEGEDTRKGRRRGGMKDSETLCVDPQERGPISRQIGVWPIECDKPLQPDQIVAYALYRWASGETYESSSCSFGIGRASGVVAIRDVTAALLSVYREKVAWSTGVRKAIVLHAFADKGFPNCHGCIDCTHIYVDKPANAPAEDYYDRKRRFSVVAQVVVDLDLRILDVFVGYLGSCHDVRIIHLSTLWSRAAAGELFTGPPVMLPFQAQMNGYLLADNGYPLSEWMVVPFGGVAQHPLESRFDNKQKTTSRAVERAFGRLKGMWRLFLGSHLTNMETLPLQSVAVCILHNILIDVGIPFDENLLWEVDANGVRRWVDIGIHRPPRPLCMETSTGEAIMLRQALAERMMRR